ncbi:F-box/kelch-repeat protein At3g23880-like [Hevea brasiliensis]|uniref:F-box/kelch-repeat protein At3g23880-like n=1 Tax=Hevea brasiliensis TaxID=3981 RepID=UPI0025DAF841|nr:F-box/kelch-repeat protein At3g23880-like [Hevea brasiliensis]
MSDHLTRELLEEILSRLPVKSILICRCVSKTWYSLITNPSFIAHHLKKTAARNSGILFFSYSTRGLVWPFKENVRYLLYPDESFPANPIEELDYPFKDLKRFVDIVGSCNGVFCLSYGVYGKYTNGAALWNPSVRKIVNIPCPNITFTSHGFYKHLLGFGFDSATDDYKLVRIVYLPDSNFKFDKIPPLVEIYSLRSRGWRKVDNNDLKYVIADFSTSAFLNGTCHWVATKPPNGPGACDAIVSFSLGEEVFGEMEVPDCLVKQYYFIDVAVSDGSLLLVAITKLTEEGCFSVWKMKEYGVPGSWTNLFNISHLAGIRRLVAFRQSGEVLLANIAGGLVFYDPKTEEISATEILGNARSFYLDTLVESLVLLDEANGVSNEHSASHGGIDKDLQKNSKGKKIADSPTILNEANEILEEAASSSNSQIVIDEANEESKEEAQGESISTE